jgi:hypothetical protein
MYSIVISSRSTFPLKLTTQVLIYRRLAASNSKAIVFFYQPSPSMVLWDAFAASLKIQPAKQVGN